MKVLCIDDKPLSGQRHAKWTINEGKTYDVVGIKKSQWGNAYKLSHQPQVGYWPEHFIPLSDIDETTMERNYSTKTVAI